MKTKSKLTNNWDNYFKSFRQEDTDIYFTEEYAKLYEFDGAVAECFVCEDGQDVLLLPYLKRKINILGGEYFDFETPYGYSGPLSTTNNQLFIRKAFNNFYLLAKKNKIIAGFIRCHPLLNNHILLEDQCQVIFERNTIAMSVECEDDDIWNNQIHPKHRNKIKIAQKQGLVYFVDEDLQYLDVFKEIYRSRMDKLNAEKFYFFGDDYFSNIKKNFKKYTFLGVVSFEDKIIAAALFFKYGNYGHYHLSGSLENYMKYRPNNFLIYKTALYLKRKGVKLFHLGGGNSRSLEDSLYKFKERFSKDRYSFYAGKMIIDQTLYEKACNVWEEKFFEKKEQYKNLLLKYRY